MPTSPSRNHDPLRIARAAILNGVDIPHRVITQLESIGVDVSALKQRVLQNMEFAR